MIDDRWKLRSVGLLTILNSDTDWKSSYRAHSGGTLGCTVSGNSLAAGLDDDVLGYVRM